MCAVVFIVLTLISARLWQASVRWSSRGDPATAGPGRLVRGATIGSGVLTAGLALLMLVVIVANLQSALAPVLSLADDLARSACQTGLGVLPVPGCGA